MKFALTMAFILGALSCFADEAEVRKLFAQAGQAYDTGLFSEAAGRYEEIARQGYRAPELFFNLGNAYFKQGDAGHAILNYRRAWRLSPRDAELNANLRFAIQSAGAIVPDATVLTRTLSRLSLSEWSLLAAIAYWGSAVCGIIFLLARARREPWRRMTGAGAVVLAVSAAGLLYWYSYRGRPEMVVIAPNQQALFAPLNNSTPHFALPPGSIVRVQETSGPWLKVASGREEGWIHQSACEPVSSWQRGEHS